MEFESVCDVIAYSPSGGRRRSTFSLRPITHSLSETSKLGSISKLVAMTDVSSGLQTDAAAIAEA